MKPADFRYIAAKVFLCAGLVIAVPFPLFAQPSSQLELRTTRAGEALAGAMSKLGTDPRDLGALLTAGEAALQLDDPRSALGFFGRADDISPNNGRVKAGLGRAMLQLDQIGDGLRLMEQAGNLGYSDAGLFADRGLARDLTGNQTGAQQDYVTALRLDPGNEKVIRRRAVSYGIAGQLDLAEATLQPLLYKSDRAAWRDRAFILAMNGKTSEAMNIANQVMPKALADAIKPYMERMAMLTPGQRAAAVHMGRFPPGLVNMRVASTAVPVKTAEAVPSRAESGQKRPKNEMDKVRQASAAKPAINRATSAPPQPQPPAPGVKPAQSPSAGRVVQRAMPVQGTAPARVVQGPPVPAALATAPSRQDSSQAQAPARAASVASFPVTPSSQTPGTPSAAPAPTAPAESDRTLAQIIAEIDIPEAEQRSAVVPVNLAEIAAMQAEQRKLRDAAAEKARKDADAKEAARLKVEAAARAKAEAAAKAEKKRLADNPARYWLQIGVGRDKGALGFTLRRMKKEFPALIKHDGWSAPWGRTNRLVVGPFSTLAKAKDAEAELKKGGSDAFVWRSGAGEEVEKIGG